MADNKPDLPPRKPTVFITRGPAIPVPPGTRIRPKRIIRADQPSLRGWWMVTAAAVVVALATGILIGRFVLS